MAPAFLSNGATTFVDPAWLEVLEKSSPLPLYAKTKKTPPHFVGIGSLARTPLVNWSDALIEDFPAASGGTQQPSVVEYVQ